MMEALTQTLLIALCVRTISFEKKRLGEDVFYDQVESRTEASTLYTRTHLTIVSY